MQQDFSWHKSAKEYVKLYNSILGLPDEEPAPAANEPLAVV